MTIITPALLNDGQIVTAAIGDGEVTQPKLASDINVSHFINDAGYITDVTGGSIFDLTDVINFQPEADGQILVFSSVAGGFINVSISTDELSEGSTNLYFTDSRADARIAAASIFDVSDVVQIQPTGDGQILVWNDGAGGFVNTPITTDDLSEGSSNLYFTDQRAVDAVEGYGAIELSGKLYVNEDQGASTTPSGGAWNNAGLKVLADTFGPPAYFVRNINDTQYEPSFWGSNIYGLRFDADLTGVNMDGTRLVVAHQLGDQGAMHGLFDYDAAAENTTIASGVIDSFDGAASFRVYDKTSGNAASATTALTVRSQTTTVNNDLNVDGNTTFSGEVYMQGLNTTVPTGTSDSGTSGEIRFGHDGTNFNMYVYVDGFGWIRSQFEAW